MKLVKRFRKFFVTAVVSSVFVSLITSSVVYAGSNTLLGDSAGINLNSSASHNTFIGYGTGNSNTRGNYNTFLGSHSGWYNTAYQNTFLGSYSGYKNNTGNFNTFVGRNSGWGNKEGNENTFLGYGSGWSNKADNNTFLGTCSGIYNTEGSHNTFVGYRSGFMNTEGSGNVFLGYQAGYYETGSNKLYIANSRDETLIYGDFETKRVGIGTTSPQKKLHVAGGVSNPMILEGFADTNNAWSVLDSLPKRSLIVGGPLSNKIYFYWKDQNGKKYKATLQGKPF